MVVSLRPSGRTSTQASRMASSTATGTKSWPAPRCTLGARAFMPRRPSVIPPAIHTPTPAGKRSRRIRCLRKARRHPRIDHGGHGQAAAVHEGRICHLDPGCRRRRGRCDRPAVIPGFVRSGNGQRREARARLAARHQPAFAARAPPAHRQRAADIGTQGRPGHTPPTAKAIFHAAHFPHPSGTDAARYRRPKATLPRICIHGRTWRRTCAPGPGATGKHGPRS